MVCRALAMSTMRKGIVLGLVVSNFSSAPSWPAAFNMISMHLLHRDRLTVADIDGIASRVFSTINKQSAAHQIGDVQKIAHFRSPCPRRQRDFPSSRRGG